MNLKLIVRATLTLVLMGIFLTNLVLIFTVQIPESMQTISSVIVGASAT